MKTLKSITLLLLTLFLIAQFFGPEKNQGTLSVEAFLEDTNPPEDVKLILKESCYDCHSNVTNYPWYNNITPVNYWLSEHVKDGKKHLNVSIWEGKSTDKKDYHFDEIIEMIEENEMPIKPYTLAHPEAKLTEEQKASVINWAKRVRIKYSLEDKPE